MSLSAATWAALDGAAAGAKAAADLAGTTVGFRVGADGPWTLVSIDDSGVVDGVREASDAGACDARVSYRSERVFESLMDESYGQCWNQSLV